MKTEAINDSDRESYKRLKDAEDRKQKILIFAALLLILAPAAVGRYLGEAAGSTTFLVSLISYLLGYWYATAIGDIRVEMSALYQPDSDD